MIRKPGRERGFSLLELMIAVTIGLVLTITVAQLFIGTRRTFATTDDVSRMQENIRFAYQVLTRTIHLAGYKSSPNIKTEDVFTTAEPLLVTADGGAGVASDSFTVSYEGSSNGPGQPADNTVLDCGGNAVQAGLKATNTFSIAEGENKRPALFCNGVELIAGVQNMQVLYGLDTDRDMVADNYVIGSPALPVINVRSMRIALLFETPPNSIDTAKTRTAVTQDSQVHTLNGVALPAFNDTYIRRVVTMTINLRNRTP